MAATGVRVIGTESIEIAGAYDIYPAQPPRRVSEPLSEADFVAPDPETYASSAAYPAQVVEFTQQTDLAGQGIAIVPLPAIRDEIEKGTIKVVNLSDQNLLRPLGIIHKRGRHLSPAAEKFIEVLRREDLAE